MDQKATRFKSKVGYGVADLYGGGAFLIVSIMYLYFLTDVVLMSAWMAGLIPFLGRVWDAVTDPLMGRLVDKTKSKFGAKRLYLLIGSFVASLTFMLIWVNVTGPEWFSFFFYLITFCLFSTGFTIVMVPYNALLPDMITDYHLRGQYTAIRMIFSALSAILGGLLPDMIINRFGGESTGYLVMGIVFGVIFFVALFITFLLSWELPSEKESSEAARSMKETFSVFKNRAFRIYLGVYLFGQGSVDFIMALILYFLAYVMMQRDQYVLVMAGVLSSQLLAMVLYQFLLKKYSKKLPAWIGFSMQLVATLLIFFVATDGGSIMVMFVLAFFIGFGTAAGTVTSFSFLADMADVDELITSRRRAGTYSGMATFTRKIANGLALGLVGLLLYLFGYDGNLEVQATLTTGAIRLMFIVLPILFIIGALYFIWLYPVSKEGFEALRKAIKKFRNAEEPSLSDEEKLLCETMTGYKFEQLWSEDNV